MNQNYLESIKKQFLYYKGLADKTLAVLGEDEIHWQSGESSNSAAIIVKHLAGNMLSRWTNFLTEDGEKEWRKRDEEFEDTYDSKADMTAHWESGWACLFKAIDALQPDDMEKIIYIRNEGHTVTEAINRQLAHYAYHVGQLVYIGKLLKGDEWVSLSIPAGRSSEYNREKFSRDKERRHFTDDV